MKGSSIKDFYFLLVILFSGRSLELFRGAVGLVLLFLLGLLIFNKQLLKADHKLNTCIIIWLFYVVFAYISIHYINRFFWFTYVAKITIAYLLLSYYGTAIVNKYVKIIYYLSIISLVFWVWGTLNRPSLFYIISLVDLGGVYGGKGIGIFYIDPGSYGGMMRLFSFCNSGFCWEPGPFGAFVSMALFFVIAQRDKVKVFKRYIIVFFLTIITTQSSTGYLLMLLVLLFSFQFWINNKNARFFLYPFVFLVGFLLFTEVPVLNEKIVREYSAMEHVETSMINAYMSDQILSLGRFASFHLDWMTFKQYPIFGINGNAQLHIINQMYPDGSIAAINGLGNILSTYGAFGTLFFFFFLIKSSIYWKHLYKYRGWYYFTVLILITGFSFSIIESVLYITFLFAPIFIRERMKSGEYPRME